MIHCLGIQSVFPGLASKFVFPGLASKFVFPGLASKFVFPGLASKFVFPGLASKFVFPGLAPKFPGLVSNFVFLGPAWHPFFYTLLDFRLSVASFIQSCYSILHLQCYGGSSLSSIFLGTGILVSLYYTDEEKLHCN